jgi:ADP-dependent NAD(P)H-hydrate dehydratase / NAD(P)H-hydrate epimerase
MTYVVTPDKMRAAERAAIDSGRSEAELICDAASGISAWVEDNVLNYGQSRKVLGLVGPGTNGADTLVAMSYLIEMGWSAVAWAVEDRDITTLPADQSSLQSIVVLEDLDPLADVSVILDGMFGIGGRPELPERAATIARQVAEIRRRHRVPIVAIDVPSGIDSLTGEASDDAIQADVTLPIGFMKVGLLYEPAATLAGDVEVIDIGLPVADDNRGDGRLRSPAPSRPESDG